MVHSLPSFNKFFFFRPINCRIQTVIAPRLFFVQIQTVIQQDLWSFNSLSETILHEEKGHLKVSSSWWIICPFE